MKIVSVGGGPAGLYCSMLMKKARPDAEIVVFERNPDGATYGWGVVFSDRTLAEFREADYPTYREITDAFVIWDSIDVRYRDRVIRCGGQVFAGISRPRLLAILQDRCLELGVEIRHEDEIADLESFADADLILAADGVNSTVRRLYEDSFRPSIELGRAKFIWFGTTLPFDSFTFVFRQHEHGLYQVHAYPFDGETSTFIVECGEETWHHAGLDAATEAESAAYCEELFSDVLAGHRLLTNKSDWLSFPMVKNASWRHGNVVLLGDSAHTAHFSIGSGTKLAMEDAIALTRAFEEQDDAVAPLFYERERRPFVERFQRAAAQSQSYFENTRRYLHLEPDQFAFHLLTRSGRIDYGDLRRRDRQFVDGVDRTFWASYAARNGSMTEPVRLVSPPPVLVPFRLGGLELANRVVLDADAAESALDGLLDPGVEAALELAVRSGPGLAVTERVAVSPEGRITPRTPGLWSEEQAALWRVLLERLRSGSETKIAVRLGHAGPRGATRERGAGLDRPLGADGWPLLAASAQPYAPGGRVPKAMDAEDLARVLGEFRRAAELAAEADFDVLAIDTAHGYLLGCFVSPLTNLREDEYGGMLEARLRFPLEVVREVRAIWPRDRGLAVAINATDWARGGTEPEEAASFAAALLEEGCDLVEVCAGQTTARSLALYDPYHLIAYADRIRNEVRVPTLATPYVTSVDEVNTILDAGRADLCLMRSLVRA